MYHKKLSGKFSVRDIKIMQKAKACEVDSLSNEYLVKELIGLTFSCELSKDKIDVLLKFYRASDTSIKAAQSSS